MRGIRFLRAILVITILLLCLLCYHYYLNYLLQSTDNSWEADQLRRQTRLQNVCAKQGPAKPTKQHPGGWLVASELNFYMCRNHKVGTSTYISTTFQQIAKMKKFKRRLLSNMFWGTSDNLKSLQNKTSLSITVIYYKYLDVIH